MAYCLCSVQGSNVLCLAVPQPRPELRFAGPYVLVAPRAQTQSFMEVQRPVQYTQHLQLCSGAKFSNTVEEMGDQKLRWYVEAKQRILKIPDWCCIKTEESEIESVRRYAKDLLVAPDYKELKTLYEKDREDLKRCISAMEHQNMVKEDHRATFEDSFMNDREAVLKYAVALIPSPIYRDFTTMNEGQKQANIIRMMRDLCILPNKRPTIEVMTICDLNLLSKQLLKLYPRLSPDRINFETLASEVR